MQVVFNAGGSQCMSTSSREGQLGKSHIPLPILLIISMATIALQW